MRRFTSSEPNGATGPSPMASAKFDGMTVSDAQRLRTLEAENARLKRLLAEQMLENAALKDLASKNF